MSNKKIGKVMMTMNSRPFIKTAKQKNKSKAKLTGMLLTYGVEDLEFISLIAALIAISKFFYDILVMDFGDFWYLNLVIGVLTLFYSCYRGIYKIHRFNKDISLYYEKERNEAEKENSEITKLPLGYEASYQKAIYTNKTYQEYYVYSNKINEHLFYEDHLMFKVDPYDYKIPENIRKYVPFALKDRLLKNATLFNGKSWGLASDIYLNSKIVSIKKVKYFDMLATNHLVHKTIKSKSNIDLSFNGKTLFLDEESRLRKLSESSMSDIIGVNTLAVTKDHYLIIGRQGKSSEVSPEDFVPSGSGSLQREDVLKIKSKNFLELIAFGATRELLEECNLPKKSNVKTRVFGYVRLLKRGGKPDFFCVSFIDATKEDIDMHMSRSKEVLQGFQGLPRMIKLQSLTDIDGMIQLISKLEQDSTAYKRIDMDDNNAISKVSLQLHVTKKFLQEYQLNNINPFKELEKQHHYEFKQSI